MEALTWDELADVYKKETGRTARIQPMDTIFEWAERRTDIFLLKDDCLYLKPNNKTK